MLFLSANTANNGNIFVGSAGGLKVFSSASAADENHCRIFVGSVLAYNRLNVTLKKQLHIIEVMKHNHP
jgi:hypothetical protein